VITDRGTPVARLVPLSGARALEGRNAELAREGLVREPSARRHPRQPSRGPERKKPRGHPGRTGRGLVRFWDTSEIIPLLLEQEASDRTSPNPGLADNTGLDLRARPQSDYVPGRLLHTAITVRRLSSRG
jgi:antitoxin (DNA-binding transcriptional repressor) of toxin-antitoxin stability system